MKFTTEVHCFRIESMIDTNSHHKYTFTTLLVISYAHKHNQTYNFL